MRAIDVFLGLFVFLMIFTFFSFMIFGNSYLSANPIPSTSSFTNIPAVFSEASNITGGTWSWNILGANISLEVFHQVLIDIMFPFLIIINMFIFIGSVIAWLFGFIYYPFSFIPNPYSSFMDVFLTGIIVITILTSIKVINTGLG